MRTAKPRRTIKASMTTTMIRTSFEAGDGAAGGGGAEFAILRGSGFVVFKSYVNDAVYRG